MWAKRDEETTKKFRDALAQLQLPPDSSIHYEKGSPAEAILGALAREKIDMIVAGALEKEVGIASVSGQCRSPPRARSALLSHAFHQTGNKTETAAPDRFRRRLFRSRVAGFEKDAAIRCGGIMRATLCYSDHHHV